MGSLCASGYPSIAKMVNSYINEDSCSVRESSFLLLVSGKLLAII